MGPVSRRQTTPCLRSSTFETAPSTLTKCLHSFCLLDRYYWTTDSKNGKGKWRGSDDFVGRAGLRKSKAEWGRRRNSSRGATQLSPGRKSGVRTEHAYAPKGRRCSLQADRHA